MIPILSPACALTRRAQAVAWTAVCPHGRDADWMATQVDTSARIACTCTCPEEAA